MLVERISPISGTKNTMEIEVSPEQIKEWNTGVGRSVQDVFHNLTDNEREFITTGITASEWDSITDDEAEELDAAEEQSQDYIDRHIAGDR